jgi:elongator complex protein 1
VEQAAHELLEDIASKEATFVTQWNRLSTLREQIRLFRLHGIDGTSGADGRPDLDDGASSAAASSRNSSLFSQASSVGSHNSNRDIKFGKPLHHDHAMARPFNNYHDRLDNQSHVQSHAPPPHEMQPKKVPRRFRRSKIQAGSPDEDAYLEKCLLLARPTLAWLRQVRQLLKIMVYFGHVRLAQQVQSRVHAWIHHVQSHPLPAPVHVRVYLSIYICIYIDDR